MDQQLNVQKPGGYVVVEWRDRAHFNIRVLDATIEEALQHQEPGAAHGLTPAEFEEEASRFHGVWIGRDLSVVTCKHFDSQICHPTGLSKLCNGCAKCSE